MKPTNIHKHGCNPISSNCVIWQGPDIDCIELCKGDTVSDVVFALATELCALMEMFDVTNYELDCLGLGECAPKDFQALIQLLIDKVCACCDIDPIDPKLPTEGCPDCEVTVCSDFYYQNSSGDTITTMQLVDYVRAIGNKVCDLILEIHTINLTLDNHETRITILEEAEPPIYTPPQVTPCTQLGLPLVPTEMNIALQELMDQYCVFVQVVGTVVDIQGAIAFQCIGLAGLPQLSDPGSNMDNLAGWEDTPATLEDTIRNMWLTICDMRAAIINIQENCCDEGCDGINWIINASLDATGVTLTIDYSGTVPAPFVDCSPASTIEIVDGNGVTYTLTNQQIASLYLGGSQAIDLIPTPLNGTTGLTITFTLCVTDPVTGTVCSEMQIVPVPPTGCCPTVSLLNPGGSSTELSYDLLFTNLACVPTTAVIEVWNQSQTFIVQDQVIAIPAIGSYTGTFVALTAGATYYVRATVGGAPCAFQSWIMPIGPCLPPDPVTTSTTINP
jgi:hypothetical protein